MDTPYFTVSQFNKDIQFIIEECPHFKDVWISGEISQLKFYSQGNHYYFFLSDGDASINCVIYSNFIKQLQFKPSKGQHVIARGKLKFYPKKGTLLFQIAYMSPIGKGVQTQNLEALKKKLQSQGIFNPENPQSESFIGEYSKCNPIGRMANAEEMIGAILYLASDASTYVTGHNLVVDGGMSCW